jgi:predicted RNA-binding protein YlxR (DUF448 family)
MGDPIRRCVGCRQRRLQQELLRFRVDERGRLRLDLQGRGMGRGAYMCADRGCLALAAKRGGFSRALRRAVAFEPEGLAEGIVEALQGWGDQWIAQCRRDGRAHGAAAHGCDDESSCSRRRLAWRRDTWQMTEPRAAQRMAQIERFVTSLLEQ